MVVSTRASGRISVHPALAARVFTLRPPIGGDGKPFPRAWKTVSAQARGKYLQLHITNVESD